MPQNRISPVRAEAVKALNHPFLFLLIAAIAAGHQQRQTSKPGRTEHGERTTTRTKKK
ncbi:hypothetical protein I7I51_01529 [Histoplasma capsulatum]|uniref:Uncharacterized protein n=1 Tax=Ajellomyces capsulatus TaxID=5037 RepID=A0A8A1MEW1_AJECA|nr:hypothetical protein I7I51_01529 [Histoplasma capsulatum]